MVFTAGGSYYNKRRSSRRFFISPRGGESSTCWNEDHEHTTITSSWSCCRTRTNSRRAAAGLVHHVCPGLVVLQRADDVSCSDMFSTTTARTTMTALSWYCSNSEKSRLRTPPSSPGTGLCSSPGTGLCSSPRDGLPPPSARMRERCPGTGAHAFGVEEDICSIHVSC